MKFKSCLCQNGFTLIEIGISILVLSFALLAIAEMQIIALRGSAFANRLSKSTLLAQDRVESLMLLRYDHPLLKDNTPIEQYTSYTASDAPDGYHIQWRVNSNMPSNDKKTIYVDITWRALGCNKNFTISFIKSDL